MKLLSQIENDLRVAQKGQKALTVSVLRLLLAEIRNEETAKQQELKDDEVVLVIRRQIKKRQESVAAFRKAKRSDLAEKEEREAKILGKYLPRSMSPTALEKVVKEAIEAVGAKGPGDFGQVMGKVMVKVKGQADGAAVSALVKKSLSS